MDRASQVRSARRSFSRLARLFTQLAREQLSCGPVTLQQAYVLEALRERPRSMRELAVEIALHPTTATRIVEKLEEKGLVRRARSPRDDRRVEVSLTPEGRRIAEWVEREGEALFATVLDLLPAERRGEIVAALETVSHIFHPDHEAFRRLLQNCCAAGPPPGIPEESAAGAPARGGAARRSARGAPSDAASQGGAP